MKKAHRLSTDDYLIVIPDGWEPNLEEVFGMDTDQLYEENLRLCRMHGHELFGGWSDEGEWMRCERCGVRFVEETP